MKLNIIKKFIQKLSHFFLKSKIPSDFNATHYLKLNPDVKRASCDPIFHYVCHGIHENRNYKIKNKKQINKKEILIFNKSFTIYGDIRDNFFYNYP